MVRSEENLTRFGFSSNVFRMFLNIYSCMYNHSCARVRLGTMVSRADTPVSLRVYLEHMHPPRTLPHNVYVSHAEPAAGGTCAKD